MDRIVDIAADGRHLSAYRGFLIVSEDRAEVGRVPLDDVAAVIVHAHGVTWSTNLIVALAERGAIMLLCGSNHAPVAVCLPLDGHHAQNGRIRAQWEARKPLTKQLWRQLVVAKIRWQAAVLDANGRSASAVDHVVVQGDLKLGAFTVSFNDIQLDVGGVPAVTCASFDSDLTSSAGGFSPSKFRFDPLCVYSVAIAITG